MMRDAMENLAKYIKMHPDNPNQRVKVTAFEDQAGGWGVAWNYFLYNYSMGTSGTQKWANVKELSMGVNNTTNDTYSYNTWVNVWQHEILHGFGIAWWRSNTIMNHLGCDVTGENRGYLDGANFPEVLEKYKIESGMSNADVCPLREASTSGHLIWETRDISPTGYNAKEYLYARDVMGRSLQSGARLSNYSLSLLKRWGYDVTYLADDPPNPYPTTIDVRSGVLDCGCCSSSFLEKYEAGILGYNQEVSS